MKKIWTLLAIFVVIVGMFVLGLKNIYSPIELNLQQSTNLTKFSSDEFNFSATISEQCSFTIEYLRYLKDGRQRGELYCPGSDISLKFTTLEGELLEHFKSLFNEQFVQLQQFPRAEVINNGKDRFTLLIKKPDADSYLDISLVRGDKMHFQQIVNSIGEAKD